MVDEDIFKQITNAKVTGGGDWCRDGSYVYQVKKLTLEKGFTGVSFKAELKILKGEGIDIPSGLADDSKGEKPGLATPSKVGSVVSYVVNLSKSTSAAGNVKALMMALDGPGDSDDAAFTALLKQATDPSGGNPFRGALVADRTFRKLIKTGPNMGKPFMGHNWTHVPGQTTEAIKAARATLDAEESAAVAAQ